MLGADFAGADGAAAGFESPDEPPDELPDELPDEPPDELPDDSLVAELVGLVADEELESLAVEVELLPSDAAVVVGVDEPFDDPPRLSVL